MLALLLALATSSGSMAAVPVWDGALAPPASVKGEYCNIAVVSGPDHHQAVSVRSGPGKFFKKIAVIRSGMRVYTCNEAWYGQQGWYGIVYASGAKACSGATGEGLDIRRSTGCRSGWVSSRWITVLSG